MRNRALLFGSVGSVVLALCSLNCSSSGSGGAPGETGWGGGGSGSGGSSGSSGGGAHPDGGTGPAGDAAGAGDAWSAPEVGPPVEAGSPGQVDLTFEVHASQGAHPISPYIYGVNDGSKAAAAHATIVRTGGNRLTAYNWENNASNAGSDYQYENDDYMCSSAKCAPTNDTPGAYLKAVVDGATAAGAAALITVPIVDYVAADKGPARRRAQLRLELSLDALQAEQGREGLRVRVPARARPTAPSTRTRWCSWLTRRGAGSAIRFQLDNEPDLWSSTHAEIHPTPAHVRRARAAQHRVRDRHQGRRRRRRRSSARSTTAGGAT